MIKKCLFPAAGYGTRFLPATKSIPKEMMPIVNRPLIEYGVTEAIEANIEDICIVTGRGKHAIMDHFDQNYEIEHHLHGSTKETLLTDTRQLIDQANYTFIRQREMKGLGHAILTGRELIGNEPFAVILADDLCVSHHDSVLSQMVELYKQFRCSIVAIEEVPDDEAHKYGIITGQKIKQDLFRIENMIEKPEPGTAPSNMAIIGRYILTPDIFKILEQTPPGKNGEIQITDALLTQARNGSVLAYKFKGQRFDCGCVDGFVAATNYCYQHVYQTTPDQLPQQKTSSVTNIQPGINPLISNG
ncbi:UTP--glucose-1-phosphate uridylyltransferase GalU [Photobacterium atrarenae]|uniref:UTP--glucose-1-phosphate uridylyltransferase n=1 Tax=Photobacterium atrarenae TaxID=865757 RepID=A0ABY5GMB0_9GAMM|nr:UTP--glucose-1-phosphate uridylyltransferase GalU [Photobacterium atrarenae]UTV30469.1 UTP--glucose-1-phosphate uridylyltransferase GalU [Photobacterium atrarenae]